MKTLIMTIALTLGSITCPHYGLVPKGMDANLAFRSEMLQMAGSDPLAAAQIRTMCAEDLLFYVNTFCWTYDPRPEALAPVMPFITYPEFQDDAMLNIADCITVGEDFVMPKSRDMGASWMGLTVFEWFWHFRDNLSFLLVSRNEDYVDKKGNPKALFWKLDFLHKHQPRWLLPTGRWLGPNDPERRLLHMGNSDTDSVIDGESTTSDAGRGDRRTAMFIDEHAAFKLNDGFLILKATRDTTSCRGFNSTPQGSGNGFYEVVHNTSARTIRLHWSDHPGKSKGLYETSRLKKPKLLDDFRGMVKFQTKGERDARQVMYPDDYPFILDGKLRAPWYDYQCTRCANAMEIAQELDIDFLGSDFQYFDPEFIQILRKKYCKPSIRRGDLEFDAETLSPKRFRDNESRGILELWIPLDSENLPAKDRQFVIGSDISAGTGASNSVSSIVDRKTREKIGVLRISTLRPNPFAKLTLALAKFFNNAFMIWDASGPTGKVFTQQVMGSHYGNIYYRRSEKKITRKISDEPGYYLNPNDREALLEEYRADLADHKFINRSDRGMEECLQFIRTAGGPIEHSASANAQDPGGARTAHGDEVIADALAALACRDNRKHDDPEEPKIPPGCLAYRRMLKEQAEAKRNKDGLGEEWR